jgi:hypothetical protein
MIEILIYLGGLFLAFQFGQVWAFFKMQKLMVQAIMQDHVKEKENLDLELIIEYHNDILYLFDSNGNDFICQANTIDGLATLAKQYKNISYASVVDTKTNKTYTFIDGKVE